MKRSFILPGVFLVAVSSSAFGQLIDPVGFCPPPATAAACTTATGVGNETIAIGGTSFGMFKNGNGGTPSNPWELLVAVPNDTGGAPAITSDGGAFTQVGATADDGMFLPTTAGSIYAFAGTSGDSSMNASNLFGPDEVAARGSAPSFFEIFAYTFTPDITSNTAYSFSVGGSGMVNGTFLAAAGGTNPFTTPFTTTGLVQGATTGGTTGGNGGGNTGGNGGGNTGGSVPEPGTIMLLGTALLGTLSITRRKFMRS